MSGGSLWQKMKVRWEERQEVMFRLDANISPRENSLTSIKDIIFFEKVITTRVIDEERSWYGNKEGVYLRLIREEITSYTPGWRQYEERE